MAGAGIVDRGTAESVTAEAVARIEDLARWGTPFDRDDFGNYALGKETVHSANRIVKVEGNRAGRAIMQAIIAEIRRTPSIRVVEDITALNLARDNDRIVGVFCRKVGNRYSEPVFIRARATVLAAGGLGVALCRHHQPARCARSRHRYGGPGRRADCRRRIRAVSSHHHRYRRRSTPPWPPRPYAARAPF